MADQRKLLSFVSSQEYCQSFSPLQCSDAPQVRFEAAQNLISGLFEWNAVAVLTTTRYKQDNKYKKHFDHLDFRQKSFKEYSQNVTYMWVLQQGNLTWTI